MNYSVEISKEEIDDLMVTALEGGMSSQWIDAPVQVVDNDWKGASHASDVISRGGRLRFASEQGVHVLTLKNLLDALGKYGDYNPEYCDAIMADSILQIALFGEEVYA